MDRGPVAVDCDAVADAIHLVDSDCQVSAFGREGAGGLGELNGLSWLDNVAEIFILSYVEVFVFAAVPRRISVE